MSGSFPYTTSRYALVTWEERRIQSIFISTARRDQEALLSPLTTSSFSIINLTEIYFLLLVETLLTLLTYDRPL